jgi:hypothetical protein
MSKSINLKTEATPTVVAWQVGLIKWGSFASAWGILIISVVMLVTCFLSSIGVVLRIAEIFLGSANFLAGALLLRESLNKKQMPIVVSMWPGEIALAATFLYLGIAMPIFHQGLASSSIALSQFIVVLLGLIIGTLALVLSGATKGSRQASHFSPVASLRNGVILIVGTILIAISLSQIAGPMMKPPQWNWISYLLITVPGMLILIAREGVKQRSENWIGLQRALSFLLTEMMLISGLLVMLYGSYVNLTLGANGYFYLAHIKGNGYGFTLWAAAVLFLILIRGTFKSTILSGKRSFGLQVVSQLLYVIALIAFIYGERSMLTGVAPHIIVGSAAPFVLIFLLSSVLLVVPGRVLGIGRIVTQ